MPAPVFSARRDPKMRARITADRELVYDGAEAPAADRPKHVRTGSGIAWAGEKMVLIQDDADCLALIDAAQNGGVVALPLRSPSGAGGQLRLAAALSARDWRGDYILALGSGADPSRRSVAPVRLGGG